MAITQAVLVEAGGEMELSRSLTPDFQEIDPVIPGIQVRQVGGDFVEVSDRGFVTRRGVAAAREFPVVVESILIAGQAARVEFRP